MIAVKLTGAIMIITASFITGKSIACFYAKRCSELNEICKFADDTVNAIRCDNYTVKEAFENIDLNSNTIIGSIVKTALCEYDKQSGETLNDLLVKQLDKSYGSAVITPATRQNLKNLFERLGKNDLEYQICIFSEIGEKCKEEYKAMLEQNSKSRGVYLKAALCIGIIIAVFLL